MATDIAFADYLEIQNVACEWADSYDAKDWDRLKKVLGPAVKLDYRSLRGPLRENITPHEFASVIFDPKVIGDPRVKTQHLLGGSSWKQLSDGTVQVWHQLRVAHQRYAAEDLTEVANRGHGYGGAEHTYKKIDGVWKVVGVRPMLEWFEYDLYGTLDPESK